jgi:ABC-2 type transport system ATP-binding protein
MTPDTLPTHLPEGPFAVTSTQLTKRFRRDVALDKVNLQVPEGSVYLLVGPNGAGKTTLLRTLLDFIRPTDGNVRIFGLRPDADGPTIRAQIGYVPERHDWGYGWMRVGRLLKHHATFYTTWDAKYAERLAELFEVRLDKVYGKLSKGQVRRVQLLMALAHRPRLLLLDEPTDGLDPLTRDETMGLLAEHIAQTPTTLLISTHLVREAEHLADHVGVLQRGQLRVQTPIANLRASLNRYRADVPDSWTAPTTLNGSVVRRRQASREIEWTVWGTPEEVTQHFTRSGATVREAAALSLEEATLALLSRKD